MNTYRSFVVTIFSVLCMSTHAQSALTCGPIERCLVEGNIAVIGESDTAQALLSIAHPGAQQFERYFGRGPTSIAIVAGGSIDSALYTRLKQMGFVDALPWISTADQLKLREAAIRKQVLAQTQQLSASQQQAIVERALRKAATAVESPSTDVSAEQQGALAHELGHLWFRSAFPQRLAQPATKGKHGYGGWAPDWLDESAAMLLENETLREMRRDAFRTIPVDTLYPLREYLSMEHPALKSAAALAANSSSEKDSASRIVVLSGAEAQAFLAQSDSGDPTVFYTQTQGFIDFMFALTGDERVFAKIAVALANDQRFEDWLAGHPDTPATLQAFETAWADWLDNR